MKAINIIGTAYRATIEEQDDTIVWVTHAMKGAAGDDDELDVLLRGDAVNYGVKSQDASGLSFGKLKQTEPPRIAEDVDKLSGKNVKVYIVEEDLATRGIESSELIDGLETISRDAVARLVSDYDHVWHW